MKIVESNIQDIDMVKFQVIQHKEAFHENQACLEIQEGEYAGVVFQYDNVRIDEIDEEDAELHYNFITVENPNQLDLTSEGFTDITGKIMLQMVEAYLEADSNES